MSLFRKPSYQAFFDVPVEKFDVKFDVTVLDVPISMLNKFDVPVFDVPVFDVNCPLHVTHLQRIFDFLGLNYFDRIASRFFLRIEILST